MHYYERSEHDRATITVSRACIRSPVIDFQASSSFDTTKDTLLMQMQKLREPPHSHVLRPLQPLLLLHVALIAPRGETVGQAGEILVVVSEVQARDHAVGVRFQLGRQHRIVLWGDDLHGNANGVDFFLC